MSEFTSILTNKRRIKAQLKTLNESELVEAREKFLSAVDDVVELFETERQKEQEKQKKVADILAQAEREGITVEDLAGEIVKPKATNRKKLPPKYEFKTESGELKTWTGQGRMPSALKKEVDAGAALVSFLIKS
ncbi:H-NS histone family protein [Idiomarina abyssalis]|uniref:DNA-binding protein n=1 Tax=Idiomarina abyssalis TaxID=86102 RepID=A0A8I1GBX2_9GAMM|nr:H-NS family nucleoid-associated regulatory protein [Idiomarina abyssalis]MBJ7265437.1 H-NS histone family protein [Idiomarina abyssalis]MBJ7316889.1 H-NS histone family protein [Idiomarina abyssalis]